MRAISARTEEILSGQEKISHDMSGGFSAVLRAISSLPLTSESEIDRRVEEQVLYNRIDSAIDLLDKGKPLTAKNQLEEILDDLEEVDPHIRFKVLSKIGACYLDLGEDDKGADILEEAYKILPDTPKALANLSVATLIRGNYESAISFARKCLASEPTQPIALSVLIESSFRLGRIDEIDQTELQEIQLHVESRRRYAILLTEQRNLDEAENLHRQNIESGKSELQDSILLAQVLMLKAREDRINKVPVPWEINLNDDRYQLEEAENLLNEVIESWKFYENHTRYRNVIVLRASIRGMMGNDKQALDDCQFVLAEDRNHEDALWNGGLAAFQMNDYQTAIQLLERFAITPEKLESARLMLAISYMNQKKFRNVLELLKEHSPHISIESRADHLRLKAEAAFNLGEMDEVNQIISQMLELNDDSSSVLEAIGSLLTMVDRVKDAENYLEKAFEQAVGDERLFYAFRLAEFYFLQNQFSKAAKYYEIAKVPITVNSLYTKKYLVSLLNSGNWNQAFNIAQSLRNNGPAISVISEVEARIAEYVDDFNLARELYEQLIQIDSKNLEHYIHLAYIESRQGNKDRVINILKPALQQFQDDPIFQMSAAQLLASSDYPTEAVFKIAYEAQRAGASNPHIQSAYTSLFLSREKDCEFLDPQEVSIDTAVKINSDGLSKWFVILDINDIDKRNNELHFEDPLAKRLIGLHVGDNIILSQTPINTITGTIEEIQSKYVRAFQDIFLNFNTDFPDESSIIRLHMPINDLDQLVTIPMFRSDSTGTILDSYIKQKYPLTIGSLAQLMGRNIIEVWEHLVGAPDGILRAATGHVQEQKAQSQLAVSTKCITLEIVGFLTVWYLDLVDKLNVRYEKVFFAQSLLDQLSEAIIRDKQFGNDGAKFLGINQGALQFSEIPNEQVQKRITNLEKMKVYIQENFEVVPVRGAIELGQENYQEYESLIGRHQIDSILVAQETNSVLYTDDLWLRIMADNEFGVKSIWSQAVLSDVFLNNYIEQKDLFEATVKMLLFNYHFVGVNKDLILYTLEYYKWQITREVEKVFSALSGPDTTEDSAILVLSTVIKEIWLGNMLIERKTAFLDLALRTIVKNRPARQVLNKFYNNLLLELQLAPLQQIEVDKQINLWTRMFLD